MNLREVNAWLAENSRSCTDAGISPEQAVALCRWKLSDKVDREGWSRMMPQFANWIETNTEDMP